MRLRSSGSGDAGSQTRGISGHWRRAADSCVSSSAMRPSCWAQAKTARGRLQAVSWRPGGSGRCFTAAGPVRAGLAGGQARGSPRPRRHRSDELTRVPDGFQLKTSAGVVRAREVLAATNGYTPPALAGLRRRVIPIGSYLIATRPLGDELARRTDTPRAGAE